MKFLATTAVLFSLSLTLFAADHNCAAGVGTVVQPLPGGYVAQIVPASDADHAGECYGAISNAAGKTVYEVYAHELELNTVTGKDVNGDGSPDAVLESHPAEGQCCWEYYVVSLGEPAGLIRGFSTSVPLTFEDRAGDGKIEIWTHDFSFDGMDGMTHADSPSPLIFFRLKGNTVYDVSPAFWSEYSAEVAETRGLISRNDIDDLTRLEGDNPAADNEDKSLGDDKSAKHERMRRAQALVLTLTLDYLYGGKLQEAFKTISEMWPVLDRPRIRQAILERRNHGILREINRPPKNTTPTATTNKPQN
jgi:hypothetical protein